MLIGKRYDFELCAYVWVQLAPPDPPHGMFTVGRAVVRTGRIHFSDILDFAFSFPRPMGLWCFCLTAGEWAVNPETGEVLGGELEARCQDEQAKLNGARFTRDSLASRDGTWGPYPGRWRVDQVTSFSHPRFK